MITVLITAYAVHPHKGSEDGMGWNMILQAAAQHKVIAVTRINNRPAIEAYTAAHPSSVLLANITWLYFDWPKWLISWKKGPLMSMIYYYLWQFTLALWLIPHSKEADLVHNLNFHNDWTPSFLWLLRKPFIWGHVGHHNKIPKQFLVVQYGYGAYFKDRFLWVLKHLFWYGDPFLWICKKKAAITICMSVDAVKKLRLKSNYIIHPSVAADRVRISDHNSRDNSINIISIGRFVPLKGFDLTIRSFAIFYKTLTSEQQSRVSLTLAGSGPTENMLRLIAKEEKIAHAVRFVKWLPKEEIEKLYSSATVFLFPSHEGAGMVVAEALSFSLPVICLQNTGPGNMVPPETSLIVPADSYWKTVYALSQKLQQIFWKPALLQHEKKLAASHHQQLFEWKVRGQMLNNVYKYATEKNNSHSPAQ